MSEENKSGEGSKASGEGQKVDVNEVMKRLEQLESSYNRVLEESKGHKSKAQEYKSKLEEIEKKGVEASGDLAKQLEYERKTKEKIESENKKLKTETLNERIRATVGKYAKEVHSIDDLLNQPGYKKILTDGIDPENLTVNEDAAKNFVNAVLNDKPWLKKNVSQAGVDTTKPSAGVKGADVGEVKKGEHKALLADALNKWE
jgi:archaellum component FlaC